MTKPKEDIKNISPNLVSLRQGLVDSHLKKSSPVFTFSSEAQSTTPLPEKCQKVIQKAFFISDAAGKNVQGGMVVTPLEELLSSLEQYREKNKLKLVIESSDSTEEKSKTAPINEQTFYAENAPSKLITRSSLSPNWQGWVDFFVTSNNEIILSPTSTSVDAFFGQEASRSPQKALSSDRKDLPARQEASSPDQEAPPSDQEVPSSAQKAPLSSTDFKHHFNDFKHYFNLYTLSWGASVKAAGKLRIEAQQALEEGVIEGENRLILAAESDYWDVEQDTMIPIVLQALFNRGLQLSRQNIFYLDKKDGLPLVESAVVPEKFLKPVDAYLMPGTNFREINPEKYPLAIKIAERTDSAVAEKLTALFLAIDKAVLNSKNPTVLQLFLQQDQASNTFDLLKEEIAQFLSSSTLEATHTVNVAKEAAASSSTTEVAIQSPEAVLELEKRILCHIKNIEKDYKINLNFAYENMMALYLRYVEVKREHLSLLSQEKENSSPMNSIQKIFEHAAKNIGNSSQYNAVKFSAATNEFLPFYEQDPLQTGINLLRDYIGYGLFFRSLVIRFFYRRKHIDAVKGFLDKYEDKNSSNPQSIDEVCRQVFGKPLNELQEQTGTCIERLRFCAGLEEKLNGTKNIFGLGSESLTDKEVVAKITVVKEPADKEVTDKEVIPKLEVIAEELVDSTAAKAASSSSIPVRDEKTESDQFSSEQKVNAESSSAIVTEPSPSDVHEERSTVEKVIAPSSDGVHEERSAKENVSISPLSLSPSRSQAALYSSKEKNDNVRSSSPQDDRSSEVYRP